MPVQPEEGLRVGSKARPIQEGDLAEMLAAVRAAAPATKLLVLAGDVHPATTAAVLAVGADGCLAKDRSSRQLATVIRKLAAGEQAVMATAARTPGRDPSVELLVGRLTFREREILGLLTHGLTTRRIAQQLCLSYQTVRSHIHNLSVELGGALAAGGGSLRPRAPGRGGPRRLPGAPQCLRAHLQSIRNLGLHRDGLSSRRKAGPAPN